MEFLATRSGDNALGAREIKRLIDTQIKMPLSDEILFGTLKRGGDVQISVKNNTLSLKVVAKDSPKNAHKLLDEVL